MQSDERITSLSLNDGSFNTLIDSKEMIERTMIRGYSNVIFAAEKSNSGIII